MYVHDMIVANGKYYFTYGTEPGEQTWVQVDQNRLSNFVVRSGAEAHFTGISLETGTGDVIHICTDAKASIEDIWGWGVYSINNEGEFW